MSNELEQVAEMLWLASGKYVGLASDHLHLDYTIEAAPEWGAEMTPGMSEWLQLHAGKTLPAAAGMEDELRVHFLFPNLERPERAIITLILTYSQIEAAKDHLAGLKASYHQFGIEKKLTVVQMEIVEKKIFRD